MPRNKYPELTESRIMEAAARLFLEKGYRDTSIQDIVDEVGGMTRGAFYHHFKSKEDIFDAVTTRLFLQNNPLDLPEELQDKTGLEKLKALVLRSIRNNMQVRIINSAPEFFRSDKFIALHVRETVEQIAPEILPIIEEGRKDGSIPVEYPKQAAESLLLLANIWLSPVIFGADEQEYAQRVDTFGKLLEGIGIRLLDEELRAALQTFYRKTVRL